MRTPLFLSRLFIGNSFLRDDPGDESRCGDHEGKPGKKAGRDGKHVACQRQGGFDAGQKTGEGDEADTPSTAKHRPPVGNGAHGDVPWLVMLGGKVLAPPFLGCKCPAQNYIAGERY